MTTTTGPTDIPSRRPGWLRRRAAWVAAAYLALVAVAGALIDVAGDDAAWATLVLFGPRWVFALPLLAVGPVAAWSRSRWAIGLTLAAGLVVAGPVTGGTVGVAALARRDRPPVASLRVATWNVGKAHTSDASRRFLDDAKPDVLVLQEATEASLHPAHFPDGWRLHTQGGGVWVATALPARPDGLLTHRELGAWGWAARYVVNTAAGDVRVVGVHLPTVRPGVEAVLASRLRDLDPLRGAVAERAAAARVARLWAGDPAADLIVAGDFNTPPEGRVYAACWGDFRNAFSDAGVGWGRTKETRLFGARIDHVLFARPWRCRAAWVGPAMGSDHRPLVADLVYDPD